MMMMMDKQARKARCLSFDGVAMMREDVWCMYVVEEKKEEERGRWPSLSTRSLSSRPWMRAVKMLARDQLTHERVVKMDFDVIMSSFATSLIGSW